MQAFKKCSCCDSPWFDRDEFLRDGNIDLVGYQANFSHLELGYFLFNHLTCQSTLAIPAGQFKDLYDGPVFADRLTGSESCPGYCSYETALDLCPAKCEGAYVREIMQVIRNWPKVACQLANIAQG
ncbi:MAG: hypothetical protein JSW26_17800 [Desulfobacterales bacterium]|nr:MAG: hypothetical protein JSW26_17800 [Desulfobacterales bacterium]